MARGALLEPARSPSLLDRQSAAPPTLGPPHLLNANSSSPYASSSKSSSSSSTTLQPPQQPPPLTRSVTDTTLATSKRSASSSTSAASRTSYFDTYQPYKLNPALTPTVKSSATRSRSDRNLRRHAKSDAEDVPLPGSDGQSHKMQGSREGECETVARREKSRTEYASASVLRASGVQESEAGPSNSTAPSKSRKLPEPSTHDADINRTPGASASSSSPRAASVEAWRQVAARAAQREPRGFGSSTILTGVTRRKSQQDLLQASKDTSLAMPEPPSTKYHTAPGPRNGVPFRRPAFPPAMRSDQGPERSRAPPHESGRPQNNSSSSNHTAPPLQSLSSPPAPSVVLATYAGSTAGMRKASKPNPHLTKVPARSIDDIVREYKEQQRATKIRPSFPSLPTPLDSSADTMVPPTPTQHHRLHPQVPARSVIDVDDYDSDGSVDSITREVQETLYGDAPHSRSSPNPTQGRGTAGGGNSPSLLAPSPRLMHATSVPSKLSSSSRSSTSSSISAQRRRRPSQPSSQHPRGLSSPRAIEPVPTRSSTTSDATAALRSSSSAGGVGADSVSSWLQERPLAAAGPVPGTGSTHRNRTTSLTSTHSAKTTASDLSARRQPHAFPSATAGSQSASSETGLSSIDTFIRSPRLTRILTLSRPPNIGLRVSLADVGDSTSPHVAILYLGLGAVRYLAGLYDELASALGLRLICIDRWGLGRTDNVPSERRGVLQWSSVVVEVADRLGVQRFSMLAHSAGAPYAMATALLYRERVVGPVHLLAPWVSPEIESGYKWLRYVPEQLIRTAQAAEWRVAGWRLGKAAAPTSEANASAAGEDDLERAMSSSNGASRSRVPSQSDVGVTRSIVSAIPISASVPVVLPSPLIRVVPRSTSAGAVMSSPSTSKPKTTFLGSFFNNSKPASSSAGSQVNGGGSSSSGGPDSRALSSASSRQDEVVQRGASGAIPSTPSSMASAQTSSPSSASTSSPVLSFLSSLYPTSLADLDGPPQPPRAMASGDEGSRLVGLLTNSEWEELEDARDVPLGEAGYGTTSTTSGIALRRGWASKVADPLGRPASPTTSLPGKDRRLLTRVAIPNTAAANAAAPPASASSRSSSRSSNRRDKVATPAASTMPKSASHHADLATALLRASHAEIYPSTNGAPVPLSTSSEALLEASGTHLPSSTSSSSSFSPGATADLLTILGKSGPWGFTYPDVLPLNVGLRIWHGDKDERIGLAGAFWLQKEWDAAPYGVECHVNVVKGAGHGLLTNGPVVVEVLESIAACCRERAA